MSTGIEVSVSTRMYNRLRKTVDASTKYNSIPDFVRIAIVEKFMNDGQVEFIDSKPLVRRSAALQWKDFVKFMEDRGCILVTTKEISEELNIKSTTIAVTLRRWKKTHQQLYSVKQFVTRSVKNNRGIGNHDRVRAENFWGLNLNLKDKLSNNDKTKIKKLRSEGHLLQKIADQFKVTKQHVWHIVNGT